MTPVVTITLQVGAVSYTARFFDYKLDEGGF